MLHSNRAFGDVPEQLVLEWEQVVADFEGATEPPASESTSIEPMLLAGRTSG